MGVCISLTSQVNQVVDFGDGDEDGYHNNFIEDKVIHKGNFSSTVKEVRSKTGMNENETQFAVKIIRKRLHSTKKMRRECKILRTLDGENYTLKLHSIYESPSSIFLITEMCDGGDLMQWVTSAEEELHTHDVSRIAFQLLAAINHCAEQGVIHRNIEPRNILFKTKGIQSDLRLIDFGTSSMKDLDMEEEFVQADQEHVPEKDEMHKTMVGTSFYASPEMSHHKYGFKTDVWSVGVTLYVLVAGYPSEDLQTVFSLLHTSDDRDLKSLPNLPENIPDSFFELLDGLLTYNKKDRKMASKLLDQSFVKLYMKEGSDGTSESRAKYSTFKYSAYHHNLYLEYVQFERSFTTLLAAMLSPLEYDDFLSRIDSKLKSDKGTDSKLHVMKINELKEILVSMEKKNIVPMINSIPNAEKFNMFSIHLSSLRIYTREHTENTVEKRSRNRVSFAPGSNAGNNDISIRKITNFVFRSNAGRDDDSGKSNSGSKKGRGTIHGSNVWESIRGKRQRKTTFHHDKSM